LQAQILPQRGKSVKHIFFRRKDFFTALVQFIAFEGGDIIPPIFQMDRLSIRCDEFKTREAWRGDWQKIRSKQWKAAWSVG
jgi:hypothetical protein